MNGYRSILRLPFRRRFYHGTTPAVPLSPVQSEALRSFQDKIFQGLYRFKEVPCLCGSTGGILVAGIDRYALAVCTYLCTSCGMMRTNPRMEDESLSKFYQEDYRPIYVGAPLASDSFFDNQVINGQYILEFINAGIPGGSKEGYIVFDVGCGAGGTLIPFRDTGWRAYGCDLGDDYLARGREAGLTLEHGSPSSLEQYGKANLIILSHVLEHLPDPLATLKELASMLVDGGYLYIELPGIFNIHNAYDSDFLTFLQNAHLYHLTRSTLTSLLATAGFRPVVGNEVIKALFQKSARYAMPQQSSEGIAIIKYLYFLEFRLLAERSGLNKLSYKTKTLIKKAAKTAKRASRKLRRLRSALSIILSSIVLLKSLLLFRG